MEQRQSDHHYTDIDWIPGKDVYGNSIYPANAYKSLALTGGRVNLTNNDSTDWPNTHAAALNATDNAAYRARTGTFSASPTLPIYMYAVGLSGNGDPPDPVLMQRIANDPDGDTFNGAAPRYVACPAATGCITYSTQPRGKFILSQDTAGLGRAFLGIASQVLRLSN